MNTRGKGSNQWQFSEARAKLSEVVRRAGVEGPQVVTQRNGQAVVFSSVEDYEGRLGHKIR